MARGVAQGNKIRNGRAGRYGVRVVEAADGVVKGNFARITVLSDVTLAAGTEVVGGTDLSGVTIPAGTTLDTYFVKLEVTGGTVIASYAEAGQEPGQAGPYRATPFDQNPQ
mgnify:CR=1 FL=1